MIFRNTLFMNSASTSPKATTASVVICEVYGIPHTAIELRQGHALTPADLAPYAGVKGVWPRSPFFRAAFRSR